MGKKHLEINVRDFQLEDEKKCWEILDSVLTVTYRGIWNPPSQDYHILVAETYITNLHLATLGFGSIFILNKIFQPRPVGLIEDVAVHSNWQRRGVGAAIVERLIERATQRNCYKVILNCNDENIPFYEKLGFYRKCNTMRLEL